MKTKIKKGDMVQWTVNGVDQFIYPKKVVAVTGCGDYCFVEGSLTGLPVNQITVLRTSEQKLWEGLFSV